MASFSRSIDAIVALSPVLVRIFGPESERTYDLLDDALNRARVFALTLWSGRYSIEQSVLDMFIVDFPSEESLES